VNVLDIGRLSLVGTQRADAHAVGLVADGAALEEDVLRPRSDGDGVVAVVDDAVADGDVRAADVEAVGVEGEGGGVGRGFDDRVLDGDVAALDGEVPGDGLEGLEVPDVACFTLAGVLGVRSSCTRLRYSPVLPFWFSPSAADGLLSIKPEFQVISSLPFWKLIDIRCGLLGVPAAPGALRSHQACP